MAESFYFNVVQKVLEKLGSFVYQEISSVWGVKNDLQKLQETLTSVKAVLLDAEEKQAQSHQLRDWLQKLTDACYDAEDVLDEFEVEVLRRQVLGQRSVGRKVRNFLSPSNPVAFRFRMSHKMKEIRNKLDEIAAIKAKFHLIERDDNRHVLHRERELTHSFVIASEVIGRDEDKEKIIKMLTDSESNKDDTLSVIPIVGIGGLGKTAIAKLVYNDEWANENFELKMWVCVSDDEFDSKQLAVKILKCATNENYSHLDADQLIRKLQEILKGKKYLLVLDDVWNDDHGRWIELKNLLIGEACGGKIIVTTRSDKVAYFMGTIPTYKLRGLPKEECMRLFIKCAFKNGEEKSHRNLMEIGEKIVEKCGGVPLAVKTLGSLLYSSTEEQHWRKVMDSEIWNLEQKKDAILPALRLSYDHLPPQLKRCFAYCCLFPKDYNFVEFELIQFWMAHGLLQSQYENQDFESIGMQYLKELESRSFFQDFDWLASSCTFKMHDLAKSLMKSECLMVNQVTNFFPKTIRHLSFVDCDIKKIDLPSLSNLRQVRSINFLKIDGDKVRKSFLESCISRFQLLRVLNLRDAGIAILPDRIGNLKHLRYLDISYNKEIKELPSSIRKLQSLQSLKFEGCKGLIEIPRDIGYLISLKLLDLTTSQRFLPRNGIGCLNSLRSLKIRMCKKLEYLFEDIDCLKVLRSLVILDCPNLISLPHSVKYLNSLETLVLGRCKSLNLDVSVEDKHQGLNIAGPHLRALVIFCLPEVVELPQWILRDSTTTLQSLYIEFCPKFKALPESMGDLKSLQYLQIVDCPKLSSLPKDMNCVNALRELVISGCPEVSERCKQQTGEDWSKIAHIPKIVIHQKKEKLEEAGKES